MLLYRKKIIGIVFISICFIENLLLEYSNSKKCNFDRILSSARSFLFEIDADAMILNTLYLILHTSYELKYIKSL